MTTPYRIGDPVVDCAQGRPMVVLDAPEQTVAEWSNDNDYDLLDNYANAKFDPAPDEYVVECVYVSDVRSEPSKTYTFPVSRVALIDVHHADDGRRLADRVAVDLLERLFTMALVLDEDWEVDPQGFHDALVKLAANAEVYDEDLRLEARELAEAARFGQEGDE